MVTRMRGQKIGESSHQPKSLRSSPTLTSWLEWSQQRSLAQARTFRTPYLGAGTRFFQEHLLQKTAVADGLHQSTICQSMPFLYFVFTLQSHH